MTDIRLVHLADIHLGYTGSTNLVFREDEKFAGRYIRQVDIEQAVKRLTKTLLVEQPAVDVVVIAGDLFHRSAPLPRAIRCAARMVNQLTTGGIDVVIIDGNHETSSWRHTGSPTSFLRELGAHVINGVKHKVIRDKLWQNLRLRGQLAVHALPYRAVLEGDFSVTPIFGCLNVLLTHGRVQGLPDLNSLQQEAARIPPVVLREGWDYIALGDWHIHARKPLQDAPAYYAGSLEALNFREAARYPSRPDDENAIRGALDIRLTCGKSAIISFIQNDQRPVLRLDPIDVADLESEALMSALRQRLDDSLPSDALVRLEVKGCPLAVWERLDHVEVDSLRKRVRHCSIQWDIRHPEIEQSSDVASEATLDEQWRDFLKQKMPSEDHDWYVKQGALRIEVARQRIRSSKE